MEWLDIIQGQSIRITNNIRIRIQEFYHCDTGNCSLIIMDSANSPKICMLADLRFNKNRLPWRRFALRMLLVTVTFEDKQPLSLPAAQKIRSS